MTRVLLVILIISIAIVGSAQTPTIIGYFDKDWKLISYPENAMYYRTAEKRDDKFMVKDFFKLSNALQMEAVCSSTTPKLVHDGKTTWYFENGKIERECFFVKDKKVGEERAFYENGAPERLMLHKNDKELYCQCWSDNGEELLARGTGHVVKKSKNNITAHTEVQDSLLIGAYTISSDAADTVFTKTEVPAEYRGGLSSFYRDLSADLIYPTEARRKGIEGKVFVQFYVDRKGYLIMPKILRGIGGGCDEAALEAITNQKNWTPAQFKGKSVKQTMVLPVSFKLTR